MDIANTLKALVLLDTDGVRTVAKYFVEKLNNRQFEKKLFLKTKSTRIKDEVLIIDNNLVLHKFVTDVHLYVIGSRSENPMVLDAVLNCTSEVLSALLNRNLERHSIRNNLSHVILALDEICEDGLILEVDSNLVLQRVLLKDDVTEQSMAQKIQSATEHIRFPWIRS